MSIDVRPIAVDLFAGAGGLSLGLEQAGFDVAAAVEFDPIHAVVHERNFPYGTTFARDVSGITGEEIRRKSMIGDQEITLVAGGPPCQGFSLIGKRAIDDPRNKLLAEYVRLVLELKPKYFLMENVPGLLSGDHAQLVEEAIEDLEFGGQYKVLRPVRILQAGDFGVPQARRRVFLLGAREDLELPVYPEPVTQVRRLDGEVRSFGSLPLGPSVGDALGDLPNVDAYKTLLRSDCVVTTAFGAPSSYAALLRGELTDMSDFSHPRPLEENRLTSSARTVHTEKSITRFKKAKPGTTEQVSRFLRLHVDGACNTLRAGTASDRGAYTAPRPIHPVFARVITVREAARLHSFPDWFRFHVTKWNGFRQIGNSVPPLLGRAVGAQIIRAAGITPTRGELIETGSDDLLQVTSAQAHEYYGLAERAIPQRERRVG